MVWVSSENTRPAPMSRSGTRASFCQVVQLSSAPEWLGGW